VVGKPSVPDKTQVDILRPASLDKKRPDRSRLSSSEPLTKKRRRAPLRTVSVPLESNDRRLLGNSGTGDVACQQARYLAAGIYSLNQTADPLIRLFSKDLLLDKLDDKDGIETDFLDATAPFLDTETNEDLISVDTWS